MNDSMVSRLRTARLLLRAWRDEDKEPFARLNADHEVTQFLLGPFSRTQSDAQIEAFRAHFAEQGFGRWALEIPGVASLAGMVGISVVSYEAHFTPNVEIAWRLDRRYWGQGYASEAAGRVLKFGFEEAGVPEIVALTVPANLRSQAVMKRLAMARDQADDFDHPGVPAGHPLERHVLYRLSNAGWRSLKP